MLGELRWLDGLDVAIVAAVVYALIAWMRRSRGALVALGLGLVGSLYVGARVLDLRLTTEMFRALATVSLVVLVVVFQEELRQAFEELAAWALRRRGERRPRLDTRDIVARSLFDLAREKIGALVVIPGAQLLDRHLRGGVDLDGKLSADLLESLFDPSSGGHDGAAIVENRRVTRFGVHLPLSRSAPDRASLGTRHSAALGLAERTDALCLVVSEERGTVSVAEGGRLRAVPNPDALGALIDRFYKDRHPLSQRRTGLARLLLENATGKAIAVGVAALLWALVVPGSRPIETELSLPVHVVGLPSGLALESADPPQVRATFRGARRDVLFLNGSELRVEVDASLAALGRRTFELSDRSVVHPPELSLRALTPGRIQLSVREKGGS